MIADFLNKDSAFTEESLWTESEGSWLSILSPFLSAEGFKMALEMELDLRIKQEDVPLTVQTSAQIWSRFLQVRTDIALATQAQ